jgi:hypothetical protein
VTVTAADTREALLQRHGHAYGEHGLAIAFTDGIVGEDAKRVTRKGWNQAPQLADGPFGAALLAGRGLQRNPVVVLGASGLIGLDVDGPEGAQLLRRITSERLPRTVTVETGKGWHLWYRRPEWLAGAAAKIELGPEGLEVAKDGYLVAPPALHPTGHVYAFATGREPWNVAIAELNVEPFLAHAKRSRTAEIAAHEPSTEGGRHRRLRRLAGAMVRVGATEAAILAALLVENEHGCKPPKDERVVRELARDMSRRYRPEAAA